MGLLTQISNLTTEEVAGLGRSSVRLQEAGLHKVTIKNLYETNTETPQTVLELVTKDGLEIPQYREFQLISEWDDSEKKYKDEKIDNKWNIGYILNLGRVIFGKDFDLEKHLSDSKNTVGGEVTNKDGKVTPTTVFSAFIGKSFVQGTYTEVTSKGKKAEEKKKSKETYVNQKISTTDVFTEDLLSPREVLEGETEGKFHMSAETRLKNKVEYGKGFKENKAVQMHLKKLRAEAKGVKAPTTVATASTDTAEDDDWA